MDTTPDTAGAAATAEIIKDLRARSGLTDRQLGRLLGVTVRAVHSWASGSVPAPRRAERIEEVRSRVFGVDAATPEDRRARLFDSSAGPSIFHRLLASAPTAQRIQYPVPVMERLGAG